MTAGENTGERLYSELWVSLASLLRSYTAAHGLNRKQQAMVELGEHELTVRVATRWLKLNREGSGFHWARETGAEGSLQFTVDGRLKAPNGAEEEMDMQAEAWAREIMHEPRPSRTGEAAQ
jgi:hypothetical protein